MAFAVGPPIAPVRIGKVRQRRVGFNILIKVGEFPSACIFGAVENHANLVPHIGAIGSLMMDIADEIALYTDRKSRLEAELGGQVKHMELARQERASGNASVVSLKNSGVHR